VTKDIIIIAMEKTGTTPKDTKGTVTRWHWQKLAEAQTKEQVQAVIAEVLASLGGDDVQIKIMVSPQQYGRIMQLSWLAGRYKEIDHLSAGNLIERSLQLYEQYLKELVLRRRAQ